MMLNVLTWSGVEQELQQDKGTVVATLRHFRKLFNHLGWAETVCINRKGQPDGNGMMAGNDIITNEIGQYGMEMLIVSVKCGTGRRTDVLQEPFIIIIININCWCVLWATDQIKCFWYERPSGNTSASHTLSYLPSHPFHLIPHTNITTNIQFHALQLFMLSTPAETFLKFRAKICKTSKTLTCVKNQFKLIPAIYCRIYTVWTKVKTLSRCSYPVLNSFLFSRYFETCKKSSRLKLNQKLLLWDKQNLPFRRFTNNLAWQIPTARSFYNTYCKTGSLESKKLCKRPKKTTESDERFIVRKQRNTFLQPLNSFSVSSIPSLQRRRYRLKRFDEVWDVENSSDELLQTILFLWWMSLQIEERW